VGIVVDVDVVMAYCIGCSPKLLPVIPGTFIVMLSWLNSFTVGTAVSVAPVPRFTVNVTWKLWAAMLFVLESLPRTVTVAVWVPTVRPVLGRTVKLRLLPALMLTSVVADSTKLSASLPDSSITRSPVADLPLFLTVTLSARLVAFEEV
jgi:hypothetical protein